MGKSKLNSAKSCLEWVLNLGLLLMHPYGFLAELNLQVFTEGYLTSLLLVQQLIHKQCQVSSFRKASE